VDPGLITTCTNYGHWFIIPGLSRLVVSWEFNVHFQHKYGYIRDERSGLESYPYPVKEGQQFFNLNPGRLSGFSRPYAFFQDFPGPRILNNKIPRLPRVCTNPVMKWSEFCPLVIIRNGIWPTRILHTSPTRPRGKRLILFTWKTIIKLARAIQYTRMLLESVVGASSIQ